MKSKSRSECNAHAHFDSHNLSLVIYKYIMCIRRPKGTWKPFSRAEVVIGYKVINFVPSTTIRGNTRS